MLFGVVVGRVLVVVEVEFVGVAVSAVELPKAISVVDSVVEAEGVEAGAFGSCLSG